MDQPDDQNSNNAACIEELETSDKEIGQEKKVMEETPKDNSEKKKGYEDFLKGFEEHKEPEHKITYVLQFMEKAISQGGPPSFKDFWEARKLCLSLFKEENLSFSVRSHLWSRYVELSKEANRLKEVLDEQSAFAAEQIDLAIKALEDDIHKLGNHEFPIPDIEFESTSKFLESKISNYLEIQKELSLFNAFASRINSLRKELIKTEMRIRFKNKFFQRLSLAGDKIFPKRKELIKSISELFIDDVDRFIEENFTSSKINQPFYFLREEIKALQSMAKTFTLNTHSFNQTRMKLSECWDKIKKIEKEKKKEKAKIKAVYKEHAQQIDEKITDLETKYQAGELSSDQAASEIDAIFQSMKQVQLGHADVKNFRQRLNQIRSDINNKIHAAQKEKLEKEKKQKDEINNQASQIIEKLKSLTEQIETQPVEEVNAAVDQLKQEMESLTPNKALIQDYDRQLQNLNDKISEQKIKNLPQNEQEAYDQLRGYLAETKKRRKEIKEKLELHRKASGTSGFDMEQALQHQELIQEEKERLEKVDEDIERIKEKLRELED